MFGTAIPSNWPIEDAPIFKHVFYNKDERRDEYVLDDSKLSMDDCHIFFHVIPCKELLIATALEYITFHPSNKNMNDKFNIVPIKYGNIGLFWCTFPKEYKDVCQRCAEVFKMKMITSPMSIASLGKNIRGVVLKFPERNNVLFFQGSQSYTQDQITQECGTIMWLGNTLINSSIE